MIMLTRSSERISNPSCYTGYQNLQYISYAFAFLQLARNETQRSEPLEETVPASTACCSHSIFLSKSEIFPPLHLVMVDELVHEDFSKYCFLRRDFSGRC